MLTGNTARVEGWPRIARQTAAAVFVPLVATAAACVAAWAFLSSLGSLLPPLLVYLLVIAVYAGVSVLLVRRAYAPGERPWVTWVVGSLIAPPIALGYLAWRATAAASHPVRGDRWRSSSKGRVDHLTVDFGDQEDRVGCGAGKEHRRRAYQDR